MRTASMNAQPAVRARRILLVEDNLVNQRVAVGLLTKRGHHVTVANNGREALDALDNRDPFDLVLMDVQMPEMDGLEATTRIREREKLAGGHLRIVAMTAHAMKGDRERFLASGMDAYLPKPVDPEAMFDLVEAVPRTRAPEGKAGGSDTMDIDDMRERMGDDDELIADVVRMFLEDCPVRIGAIRSAIDAQAPDLVRTTAHALKGSASNLSARGLVAAAGALEALAVAGDLSAAEDHFAALIGEADRLTAVLRDFTQGES